MKQISYIAILSFLLLAYSCDGKQSKSSFSEIKESDSVATSNIPSSPASLVEELDLKKATQKDIFVELVNSMVINDTTSYNKYISHISNIDTTIWYTPSGDEDEQFYSLLGLACRFNNLYSVKDLVLRGADIRSGSHDEFSAYDALYYAILGGNAEMVKILVDKGTDTNTLYTSTGITPLVLCVINKKYLMAEILLENGADVNGAGTLDTDYILYPLHDAIRGNDVEMVKILLKNNANILFKDVEGVDAVQLAKTEKTKEISQLLAKVAKP